MTAHYRTIKPHYINNVYISPNTVIAEGTDTPLGWVPTLAVDPLDLPAVNAFYAAGPRAGGQYEDLNPFDNQNYSALGSLLGAQVKPVTYWVRVGTLWGLTGLGSNLAPIPG